MSFPWNTDSRFENAVEVKLMILRFLGCLLQSNEVAQVKVRRNSRGSISPKRRWVCLKSEQTPDLLQLVDRNDSL